MFEQLISVLVEKCSFDPHRPVLAGVSGGPDSLCLLDVLRQQGYPVIVAHLDHGLRPTAALEAQRLRRMAEGWGLPFVLEEADVAGYAARQGLSIEEAAREARYRFLFEQAARCQAQAVAVGHTANDQVETVLMHLLRGSGLSGLRGMRYRSLPNPWSQEIPLTRPLLGVWREEIVTYLEQRGLQASLDESNLDTRFYRNRLRHELTPQLELLNPGAQRRLWQMADILAEDEAVLAQAEQIAWQGCWLEQGQGFVALGVTNLRRQPVGLQRRLLRRAMAVLRPGLRDIDFSAVERGLRFLGCASRSNRCDLAGGLRLEMEGERLWLATWEADLPGGDWPQIEPGKQVELAAPGKIELAGGWRLTAETMPAEAGLLKRARVNADPYQAWLDCDKLTVPLVVRGRKAGERFRPFGMAGHSLKLADFMTNCRMPRRGRAGWPLAVSGEQIVWLPGYRIGEDGALQPDTQRVVHLTLEPIGARLSILTSKMAT